jgi:hypothetical protein
MKKILFLLLFLPAMTQAQTFGTCTVSGKLYLMDGSVKDSIKVMVVKTVPRGTGRPIVIQTRRTYYSDSAGNISMPLLRNSDVTFESNAYGLTGKTLYIPDAATATLESLVPAAAVPNLHVVAVPSLTTVDSSGGSYVTDSIRIGSGLRLIQHPSGGGTPTLIATGSGTGDMLKADSNKATSGGFATVQFVYDNAGTGGATDTTSLSYRIDVNKDGIAGKAEADSVSLQIKAVKDLIGGKGGSDSLKVAYDTLSAHRTQIDTKQNTLSAAQIARLDSSLASGYAISITSSGTIQVIAIDTTGLFNAWGGVMTESDPLSIAKDTASLAVYGDQMYPRSAPPSLWTDGTPSDSTAVLGSPTETKGVHVYGGLKLEGAVRALESSVRSNTSTQISSMQLGSSVDAQGVNIQYYGSSYAITGMRRVTVFESLRDVVWKAGTAYQHSWYASPTNVFQASPASARKMMLTRDGKVRIGDDQEPANSLEISGNISQHKDSTADLGTVKTPMVYTENVVDTTTSLNPNGQTFAAIVTAGAGDSVQVTVTGVLPTDAITVSYIGGTTAPTAIPWSNVFAANTLTIYGTSGRKLSYIRIRK